jgi:DNA polymerase III delta prime subunit
MGLSFAQTKSALIACVRAKITAMLVGPPGCGKTALIRAVAREVTLPCHELLASNCDATDIAGLAYVANGDLRRALLPQIKACVDAPGLLFLDEISQVTPSVHGPLMRLLLEGYAGGQPLHSGSAILAAANRPEECPGGIELTAATVNRVIKITDFFPTLSEIRAFFEGPKVLVCVKTHATSPLRSPSSRTCSTWRRRVRRSMQAHSSPRPVAGSAHCGPSPSMAARRTTSDAHSWPAASARRSRPCSSESVSCGSTCPASMRS